MTIDSRALVASGVEIGQAVFMEESQPVDLSFFGRRYLQSGNIETDTSKFDTSIFTSKTATGTVDQTSGFSGTIEDFAHDGSQFVAVGGTAQISTSPDAEVWTIQASHTFVSQIRGVAWGNSTFVAVGTGGVINYSPDGVTWLAATNGFGGSDIYGVIFENGVFVAFGGTGGGKIASSLDGITWTQRTPTGVGTNDFKCGAYGAGLWIVAGDTGAINTSPDLITWTLQTAFNSNTINCVAFGNGVFLAGSNNDFIQSSPDTVTWSEETAEALFGSANVNAMAFIEGYFIATGEFNRTSSTIDASEWTLLTTPSGSSTKRGIGTDGISRIATGGDIGKLTTIDFESFAGSTVAHAEFGENQYVRIS